MYDYFLTPYTGTLICYGQTGAGKTYTMMGTSEGFTHRGIVPRAISQMFQIVSEMTEYSVNMRLVVFF